MSSTLSPKARMAISRTRMPAQPSLARSKNFKEVNLGLSEAAAIEEAHRCLLCRGRNCVSGCPVAVSIPEFIGALAAGQLAEAAGILQRDNALPAVCGRVCPQESQCEAHCVRGKQGDAVAIGYLERFVADWATANSETLAPLALPAASGRRVAVVGCGPSGLTVAGELAGKGHQVTIFEALHDTGGVLRYGIPEFRLPKEIIDVEVERLMDRGVQIECNVIIGKTMTLADLRLGYDAVFLGNGAGLPVLLDLPGENLNGVYAANEYLTRINLMGAGQTAHCPTPIIKGKKVAVIGAGNTAMDCVRTARRLGAEAAMIVYRREEEQMPARVEEIHHAKEEGVEFVMLAAPLEIRGDDRDWVASLLCQKMALAEADDSGRRRPIPIAGETFLLETDVVINALGTRANPLLTATAPDLQLNRWGNISANEDGSTSLPGVFAGGDIVRGGATVILAMGDGKRAAAGIDTYLHSLPPRP
jgi:glutamate synthase (NADPH/NADH) small chain